MAAGEGPTRSNSSVLLRFLVNNELSCNVSSLCHGQRLQFASFSSKGEGEKEIHMHEHDCRASNQ